MSTGYLPPLVESPVVSLNLAQRAKVLYDLGHFPKDASVAKMLTLLREIDQNEIGKYEEISEVDGLTADDQNDYVEAVASWQSFHSRTVSGVLSEFDQTYMLQPRCGMADIMEVSGDGVRQWGIKDVTVSHNMASTGMTNLSAQQIMDAYQAAVDSWNAVCGIRLQVVAWTGPKQANIWARAAVINGRGGTLAWSYLPNDDSGASTRLEQRFDPNENWNKQYLQAVAAHEIGHALGLDHIQNQSALLYPYARQNVWLPQSLDIAQVVKRYGKPSTPVTTTTADPGGQPPTDKVIVKSAVLTMTDGTTQTLVAEQQPAGGYNPL